MESIGDILKRWKSWDRESAERELAREESIAKANRDFNLGLAPGLVSYIRELRQKAWEADYDISSLLWQLAGIDPDPHQTFEAWVLDERFPVLGQAINVVRGWAEFRGKPFVTLVGPPGVGKTHLAKAACQDIISKGNTVMYRHAGELIDQLRRATLSDRKEEVMCDIGLTSFLILDDLGVEKLTEWGLGALDEIVDVRYSQRRNLLVCTNAKAEDLPPRVADRLADKAVGEVIALAVPSFRRGR